MFRTDQIVDSYELEELLESRNDRELCDFLPNISGKADDQAILESWKTHLTVKGRPWAVTRVRPNRYVLWKIEEGLHNVELQLSHHRSVSNQDNGRYGRGGR